MGTFRIAAFGVNTKTGIGAYALGGAGIVGIPSNADVLTIINKFPFDAAFWTGPWTTNPTGTLLLLADASNIYLDGSVTSVTESGLPAGFNVLTANLAGTGAITGDPTATLKLKVGASLGTSLANPGSGAIPILAYPSIPPINLNYVLANFYGATWTNNNINTGIIVNLYIEGTYNIISWSWSFADGTDFAVPVTPAQTGKLFLPGSTRRFGVSSGYPGTGVRAGGSQALGNVLNIFDSSSNPLGTGPDLKGDFGTGSGDGITKVVFSWMDAVTGPETIEVLAADFEDWTWFFFWFYLPDTLPEDTLITVSLESDAFPAIPAPEGTGTQFSGSVKLGVIKILLTAASGIYKIVADKTADTLYINSPTDDTTADFAMPDPFAKTGFIGG